MSEKVSEFWDLVLPFLASWYPAIIGIIIFLILCSPRLTLKIAAWVVRVVMFRLRVVGKENMPKFRHFFRHKNPHYLFVFKLF